MGPNRIFAAIISFCFGVHYFVKGSACIVTIRIRRPEFEYPPSLVHSLLHKYAEEKQQLKEITMTLKAKKVTTSRHRCLGESCHSRKRSKTPKMVHKITCLPPIANKENVEVPSNTPVKHLEDLHLPNIRERTDRLFNAMVPQEDNLPDKTNDVFFLPSVNGHQLQRNTSFRKQSLQLISHVKRLDEKDKFSNNVSGK